MTPVTRIASSGALISALGFVPVPALLLGVLALGVGAMFLRWFVRLTPSQRRDVLHLIATARGR